MGDKNKTPKVLEKSSVFNITPSSRAPNVLTTPPRAGGFLDSMTPREIKDSEVDLSETLGILHATPRISHRSRIFEGFQHLEAWVSYQNKMKNFPSADSSSEESVQSQDDEASGSSIWRSYKSLKDDCKYVMSVAISTLMVIAAEKGDRPTNHHIAWTVHFLNSIKTEDNKSPINISGIKKLLESYAPDIKFDDAEEEKKEESDDDSDETEAPQTARKTTPQSTKNSPQEKQTSPSSPQEKNQSLNQSKKSDQVTDQQDNDVRPENTSNGHRRGSSDLQAGSSQSPPKSNKDSPRSKTSTPKKSNDNENTPKKNSPSPNEEDYDYRPDNSWNLDGPYSGTLDLDVDSTLPTPKTRNASVNRKRSSNSPSKKWKC